MEVQHEGYIGKVIYSGKKGSVFYVAGKAISYNGPECEYLTNATGLYVRVTEKTIEVLDIHTSCRAKNIAIFCKEITQFLTTGTGFLQVYDQIISKEIEIEDIIENPWIIAIYGIVNFPVADRIAIKKFNFEKTDPLRISSFIETLVVEQSKEKAEYYIERSRFEREFKYQFEDTFPGGITIDLYKKYKIKICRLANRDSLYITSDLYYEKERTIREIIGEKLIIDNDISNTITNSINNNNKLTDEQKSGVKNIFCRNLSVISGFPGSGKTSILQCAVSIFEDHKIPYTILAPTGTAVKRIKEVISTSTNTNELVGTIHSFCFKQIAQFINAKISRGEKRITFRYNSYEREIIDFGIPKESNHIIICDESSMIDIDMAYLLLSLFRGCKFVFVGDHNQLSPIGLGLFFEQLCDPNVMERSFGEDGKKLAKVCLSKIFRQKSSSAIIENALSLLDRKQIRKEGDFGLYEQPEANSVSFVFDYILKNLVERLNAKKEDICILTPFRKWKDISTNVLNTKLQNYWNASGKSTIFPYRMNDIVMQTNNIYGKATATIDQYKGKYSRLTENKEDTTDIFNGEEGKIVEYCNGKMVIDVNGRLVAYSKNELHNIELSYAKTIHKSQGNQYKYCIILLYGTVSSDFLNREMLYTGITRSVDKCFLLTTKKILDDIVMVDKKKKLSNLFS